MGLARENTCVPFTCACSVFERSLACPASTCRCVRDDAAEVKLKLNLGTLLLGLVVAGIFLWHAAHLPWTPERILGMAIAVPAFVMLCVSRIQLGRAFSVKAKASALISTGIYSRIRNPIYVFGSLMIAGAIVWSGRLWFFLIFLVLIPVQVRRARRESKLLEEKFGLAYLEYKQKTWF